MVLFVSSFIAVLLLLGCGGKEQSEPESQKRRVFSDEHFKIDHKVLIGELPDINLNLKLRDLEELEGQIVSQQLEGETWNLQMGQKVSRLKLRTSGKKVLLSDDLNMNFEFYEVSQDQYKLLKFNQQDTKLIYISRKSEITSWTLMSLGLESLVVYFEKNIAEMRDHSPFWEDTKQISLCGEYNRIARDAFLEAVGIWNRELQSIRTPIIKASFTRSTIPFGDLNTHCIYLSEGLFNKKSHSGETWSISSRQTGFIIDSDILISSHLADTNFRKELQWTLLHEIGHWLGLSHPENHTVESIMSYRNDIHEPTQFDIHHLKKLYRPNRK